MAWCRQALSYYLSRCWPRSISLHSITRPQWVKEPQCTSGGGGGRFKNVYELLNLRALKISMLHKNHIFPFMGKKFHTKYLTHTLKDVNFIHRWRFKSSQVFLLKRPPGLPSPSWGLTNVSAEFPPCVLKATTWNENKTPSKENITEYLSFF